MSRVLSYLISNIVLKRNWFQNSETKLMRIKALQFFPNKIDGRVSPCKDCFFPRSSVSLFGICMQPCYNTSMILMPSENTILLCAQSLNKKLSKSKIMRGEIIYGRNTVVNSIGMYGSLKEVNFVKLSTNTERGWKARYDCRCCSLKSHLFGIFT